MENSSNRGTSQEENIRYYIILIIFVNPFIADI